MTSFQDHPWPFKENWKLDWLSVECIWETLRCPVELDRGSGSVWSTSEASPWSWLVTWGIFSIWDWGHVEINGAYQTDGGIRQACQALYWSSAAVLVAMYDDIVCKVDTGTHGLRRMAFRGWGWRIVKLNLPWAMHQVPSKLGYIMRF